ncbi:hypothetical protein FE810_02845 [Thalassotalea litorea]|uniref:Lipoprotein n=1 Tax=Thalassotalea litorea TaxID=2020715 RepID=A0A5R9IT33_9GAMM|nr:hypothetical protein [Thalassotalea litorea]TLU67237.1 hypothetical protein FE810_02845 [Thalassotalea litorea]
MLKYSLLLLYVFCTASVACGKEAEYSPILSLGAVKKNYTEQSKLFIPNKVNDMEIVSVYFEIEENKNFLLPIHYYENNEFPPYHKDGYVTVVYKVERKNLSNIKVHAAYKDPVGPNGEISFCIHAESFTLSELI